MLTQSSAWLYLRKSRAEANDPDLLSAHRSTLLRLAATDGVTIPADHIIEEIGSADTLRDRPKFRALLDLFRRLPAGAGGVLYCMDVDRLTRGPLSDRGAVQAALLHAAIRIRTPERYYDLAAPDDELMYEVRGLLGRQELASYRRRVTARWDDMTRNGEVLTGVVGYGYRWDRNARAPVPHPEEFAVVQALFSEAIDLSTRRLGPKYGLRPDHVLRILRNPLYSGWPARHYHKVRWKNGTGSTGTQVLKLPEMTWPEKPGRYPAAVSREQWEAVQAALDRRCRERAKTGTTPGWCRDVVEFEGRAGARIQLGSHHAAAGRYLAYTTVPEEPPRLYVERDLVHAAAFAALSKLAHASEALAAALSAHQARKEAEAASRGSGRDREALAGELASARAALARLKEEAAAGDGEDRLANQGAQDAVKGRIEALKREMGRQAPIPDALPLAVLASLPPMLEHLPETWEAMSEGAKRRLVNAVLAAVVVRVTPRPHPQAFVREVVAVRYQEWLGEFMEPSSPTALPPPSVGFDGTAPIRG